MLDNKTIKLLKYTRNKKHFTKFFAWAVVGRGFSESINHLVANQLLSYAVVGETVYYKVTIAGRAAYDNIRYERSYNASTRTISVLSLIVSVIALLLELAPRLIELAKSLP